ncbi:hypothetical protein CFC21_063932 [Triticum aestivum]|uniref:Thaumatin-like protein n=2 Tax=Triticum aestivum TaxID=4565 RepID=A0A3B6K9K3_WHEAT|nr:hypothetical protein CFC21_063932 [Triticum aestivum]
MATPAAISSAILLLLFSFSLTAGARGATFTVMNFCPFVVYPAAIPVGWGAEIGTGLGIGQAWNLAVPAGASSVRIWARTNCTFDPATGRGSCGTSDCDGALRCDDYRKPPVTQAEFTLGSSGSAPDSYNYSISLVDGFNVPMGILCPPKYYIHYLLNPQDILFFVVLYGLRCQGGFSRGGARSR